ncbi:MAG: hypothetical protein MK077_03865 [Phycisphaerales bacterium]|nr:hypothetical protein [Phycisphaerales bacterium]
MNQAQRPSALMRLPLPAAQLLDVPQSAPPQVLLGFGNLQYDRQGVEHAWRHACEIVRASELPEAIRIAAETTLTDARSVLLTSLGAHQHHPRAHGRQLTAFDRRLLAVLRGGWTPRTRRRAIGLAARHGLPLDRFVPVLHGMADWLRSQRMAAGVSTPGSVPNAVQGSSARRWMPFAWIVLSIFVAGILFWPEPSSQQSVALVDEPKVASSSPPLLVEMQPAPEPAFVAKEESFPASNAALPMNHVSMSRVLEVGRGLVSAAPSADKDLVELLRQVVRAWPDMNKARRGQIVLALVDALSLAATGSTHLNALLSASQEGVDAEAWYALMADIADVSHDPVLDSALAAHEVQRPMRELDPALGPVDWSTEITQGDLVWSATWRSVEESLADQQPSSTIERVALLRRQRLLNEAALSIALGRNLHSTAIGQLSQLEARPLGDGILPSQIRDGDAPGDLGPSRGMQGMSGALRRIKDTIGPLSASDAQTAARQAMYGDLRPRTAMQSLLIDRHMNDVGVIRALLDAPPPSSPSGDVRNFVATIADDNVLQEASPDWAVAAEQSIARRVIELHAARLASKVLWDQWEESLGREAALIGGVGEHVVAAVTHGWTGLPVEADGRWSLQLDDVVRLRLRTLQAMAQRLEQPAVEIDLVSSRDAVDQLLMIERAMTTLWDQWLSGGGLP